MTGRPVLVTGGAGFIGSHLVDRLVKDGFQVTVLDNEATGCRDHVHPAARFVRGDVTRAEDLDRVFEPGLHAVFHVAAQASTIRSFAAPEEDLRTNVGGTLNVITQCLRHHVPRLLYASSMMVYGHPRTLPTPESEACRPVSYYGITKYAAERYVSATAERADLEHDFAATSFRMFNVYGERQSLDNPYQGVAAIFIGSVLRGEPVTIHGDGEQSRDFVHVRDVVEAWMLAMDHPAARGQVFNLGTGESHSINALADLTLATLGRSRTDHPVRYGPARPSDIRHVAADITLARRVVGWEPRVDFEAGMAETIRWAAEAARPQSRS